jgi:hypothetical protein
MEEHDDCQQRRAAQHDQCREEHDYQQRRTAPHDERQRDVQRGHHDMAATDATMDAHADDAAAGNEHKNEEQHQHDSPSWSLVFSIRSETVPAHSSNLKIGNWHVQLELTDHLIL